MADYRFAYRSRCPSYEEYPCNEEWSYSSNCTTHPVGMDPDGTRYGTAWNPSQKPNGEYLVQTETYVVHPPAFGGYRYAPPKADYRMNSDFIDRHRSPPMPSPHYDRPPEVEKFLTRVQDEASRPLRFSPPVTRNWSYNCDPPEYKDNYTRYRNEGGRPAQFGTAPPARANWVRNPAPVSHGTYPAQPGYRTSWPTRIESSTIEPSPASSLGGWGNYPGMVNQYRQPGRDTSLSRPIDDINEMAEYLKRTAQLLSEPKTATPKRDVAPEVSAVEDPVKPQNNSKSSLEQEQEPEPELEPQPKPKLELPTREPEPKPKLERPTREPKPKLELELTAEDAAHSGAFSRREAIPTTADMAHSTGTITSREAAKRFNGVLM